MRKIGPAPIRFTCPCGQGFASKYPFKRHKGICPGQVLKSPTGLKLEAKP